MKNNLITLRKPFNESKGPNGGGKPILKKNKIVSVKKVEKIIKELKNIEAYWNNKQKLGKLPKFMTKRLVLITYSQVVAKSNRIQRMLKDGTSIPTDSIVGARFEEYNTNDGEKDVRHQVTYYISENAITNTIKELSCLKKILIKSFNSQINKETLHKFNIGILKNINLCGLSKTSFAQLVVDVSFINRISYPFEYDNNINGEALINLYDLNNGNQTKDETMSILNDIGVSILPTSIINNTTVKISSTDLKLIQKNAPYLIAMGEQNLSDLKYDFTYENNGIAPTPLPDASDEPIIGVIDANCYANNYFKDWVKSYNIVNPSINESSHGTEVTSLIVDGATLNPELDDGCGRFRVRHFGIMKDYNTSFDTMKEIESIVENNRDIKVWNFSYGTSTEINNNFISAEGSFLDNLQNKYNDIIFVVSGTNKNSKTKKQKIGSPADSLNSIVVNSVNLQGKSADYTRNGPVLSFFVKPDVSYYGGTLKNKLNIIKNDGKIGKDSGTSFAAPWIARKLAYLIQKMGMNREIAKALIIDSSIKWNNKIYDSEYKIGHGIVPIRIENVLSSENDEIKFVLSGDSKMYNTYTDGIPIPMKNNTFPYMARATMVYFPECTRNQGVDYTNTELDLHFGRIKGTKISTINNNKQGLPIPVYMPESKARTIFRKWDNVKIIKENITSRSKPKKAYGTPMWEISIKSKERLKSYKNSVIRFAVVVTLKNLNKENKIDAFIQACKRAGWITTEINIKSRLRATQQAKTEIELDTNE